MEDKIIYFELNENNKSLFSDEFIKKLNNRTWTKEQKICVMSFCMIDCYGYLITAKESWVKENCPKVLDEYHNLQRFPDKYGDVFGEYDIRFFSYTPSNFGIEEYFGDEDENYGEEYDEDVEDYYD